MVLFSPLYTFFLSILVTYDPVLSFLHIKTAPLLPRLSRLPRLTRLHDIKETTLVDVQDGPASMIFYDDVISDVPDGVVCARGVCVFIEDGDDEITNTANPQSPLSSPLAKARLTLFFSSVLYGTNFPLGALMNDSLPASAATSSRMVLAAVALSPFLPRLKPSMAPLALLCGCFTATGYIAQSLALVDTSPSTVSFLGALTVVVCPVLEAIVNKRKVRKRKRRSKAEEQSGGAKRRRL